MNTITKVVMVLILWLVMGLGFLSAYGQDRRKGKSFAASLMSVEGVLFALSVLVPFLILIHYNIE